MTRSPTALIVSGGGFQGLSLIKALRECGDTRVLVVDCHDENVARYFADGFYHAPLLSKPDEFLPFLLDLCKQQSVDLVFAATSFELDLLSRNRGSFVSLGIEVCVSDLELLRLAGDKLAFYDWLRREDIPCLPFSDTPQALVALGPLVSKVRDGCGGRGVQLHAAGAIPADGEGTVAANLVWQQYLPEFDEYSVDFSVRSSGEVSPLAFRRRIRTLSGFAILCEPGAPQVVRQLAQRTIQGLVRQGARGPLNLQLLNHAGQCWVSDLNARAGTSMPMSLPTGCNPVSFLIKEPMAEQASHDLPAMARSLRFLDERLVPELGLSDVRGVVFDLDDTLLDQKSWMLSKLELTWAQESSSLPPREQFLGLALQIIEEGNRAHLFDAIAQQLGLIEDCRLRLIDSYRRALPAEGRLYGDVLPGLVQLRRLGYRLAILTDNPAASQRQKLQACGLGDFVDAMVLTGELGVSKPAPLTFDASASALGLEPEQLVMVGDNLFRDIRGALQAGFKHAFHVHRAGAFFNFSHELAQRATGRLSNYSSIRHLHELFWHLPGLPAGAAALTRV